MLEVINFCCHVASTTALCHSLLTRGWGVVTEKVSVGQDRTSKERFNPMVTHRLIGVHGVPVKVEGIVSAPITIGEVTLQHDFIVSEQITAEAILGLDFLEANK